MCLNELSPFINPCIGQLFDLKAFLYQNKGKVLILSLKQAWFDLMITGEKTIEVRDDSRWIRSRLIKKDEPVRYEYVLFINGYGSHRPWFITKYEGYSRQYDITYTFSNGIELVVKPDQFVLFLGDVIHKGNVDAKKSKNNLLLLF